MRLFQISDLHIGGEIKKSFDIDVKGHFLKVLNEVQKYAPDMIMLTGDLCLREGDLKTYKWIRSQLMGSDLPFFVIPGNHDSSSMIRDVFHPEISLSEQKKLSYYFLMENDLYIFLDSADGEIGEIQIGWMNDKILTYPGKRLFIFMHHPPVLAGVPHMDRNYSLSDMEKFRNSLEETKDPVHIFTGHYHLGKSIIYKNLNIQICPACYYQLDSTRQDFAIEHAIPGFRIIDIFREGVSSQCHYLIDH